MKRSLMLLVLTAVSAFPIIVADSNQELYFTNLNSIQLLRDGSTPEVVIDHLELAEALDCNICDSRIYWVDEVGKIKRADPSEGVEEVIIDKDLIKPIGIAVDWKGNNVYFSDRRCQQNICFDPVGRVEVSTCDGAYRKVLFHNLISPGPLAINVLTGHLYFTALDEEVSSVIYKSDLDGRNKEILIYEPDAIEIVGMAIDLSTNILYYAHDSYFSDANYVKRIDLSQPPNPGDGGDLVGGLDDRKPHGLSATNNTIFWTELRFRDISSGNILNPGAIYSLEVEGNSSQPKKLFRNDSIDPQDVSSFPEVQVPHDGCAVDKAGCEAFCFTVPASNGNQGTVPRCGCPTGLVIRDNNTCPDMPDNFILFSQSLNNPPRTEIRLLSLDLPLEESADVLVPVHIPRTEVYFIAFDIIFRKLYWTQTEPPAIMVSFLDGSEQGVFIDRNIRFPEGLVVDHLSRNLYWVDSSLDRIEVVTLDKEVPVRRSLLGDHRVDHPAGIALDLARGYVYWTDLHPVDQTVEMAHLNGSYPDELPNVRNELKDPTNVAVDYVTTYVYWADVDREGRERITVYDWNSDEFLTDTPLESILGLAVHGEYVYWTDQKGVGRVSKVDGDGNVLVVKASGILALTAVNLSATFTRSVCVGADRCNHICIPSGTLSSCTCADNYVLDSEDTSQCIDMEPRFIYASDTTTVELGATVDDDLLTLQIEPVSEWPAVTASVVAMDTSEGKIYWISTTDKLIYRQSLEPSAEPERVISCCVGTPEDLAVDWLGKNLYWTDSSRGTIEVAKLNGRGRNVLARNLDEPSVLALDPIRGFLYWSSKQTAKLYRLRMDGTSSQPEQVWPEPGSSFSGTSAMVTGIAINFTSSVEDDVLYWIVTDAAGAKIYQSALSIPLMELEIYSTAPPHNPRRLRAFKSRLYWLDNFLGGTLAEVISFNPRETSTTGNQVYFDRENRQHQDFVVMHHSVQPGIHECAVNNRGCSGIGSVPEPLCLVQDEIYGTCECPAHMAKRVHVAQNGLDQESCALTDNSLLIAVSDSIYYLPVPDVIGSTNFVTPSPKVLPVGLLGDIQAIAYDPWTDDVFWVDGRAQNLYSAPVDGSSQTTVANILNVSAHSLAYDWEHGHFFLTETGRFQIELFTVNGDGQGSLLPQSISSSRELNSPKELAFDLEKFLLYWTNYGTELYTSSLRNLSDVHRVNLPGGARQIQNMTFDPDTRSLFWVNGDSETIEQYSVDSGTLETLRNITGSIIALTATTIGDHPVLFWYDESDQSIYLYSVALRTLLVPPQSWPLPSELRGFQAYKRITVVPSMPCLEDPRPCSHICEGTRPSSNYQCSCPPYRALLNGTVCSDHAQCNSPLLHPCGDEPDCFTIGYHCDGTAHCKNGFDESPQVCKCDMESERRCSPDSIDCVALIEWCDGTQQCPDGEDEFVCPRCDDEGLFGCFVEPNKFQCLPPQVVCDGDTDCLFGEDENQNCTYPPTPMPTPPTKDSSKDSPSSIIIFSCIASVAFVFLMVVLALFCCCTLRMLKNKYQCNLRPTNSASYKPSISPAPRSESVSEYSVGISSMTESTRVNMSPSTESTFKRWSATGLSTDPSNPPPSPITPLRHSMSEFDDISMATSHYPPNVPPAPPPSVDYDYDALSAMSSVSHEPLHANGLMDRHHNLPHARPNYNPLMSHRICHYNYYNQRPHPPPHLHPPHPHPHPHHLHHHAPYSHIHGNLTNGLYSNSHYPMHHRPHHRGLPPIPHHDHADTEVESVFSVVTTQTENVHEGASHYNSINDVTPPGRPPSPATVTEVSEHRGPPLSPTSPISEFSEDEVFRSDVHSLKD